MIIKTETKNSITIYYVDKDYDDKKLEKILNTKLKSNNNFFIINENADVYTKDNKLLLRYRKNKLDKKNIDEFYDNVIKFALTKTTTRGIASGSKKMKMTLQNNPKVMTNIIGYMDTMSPKLKFAFKVRGIQNKFSVRPSYFMLMYPDKFKKILPLVKEIDEWYKKLIPENYNLQRKKANQTHFKIPGTSFTTITTNVNFQTAVHTDKGDDDEGFGNLTVIEHGKYTGGETCLPQFGIGVDVRTGDVLYMNVHEAHGNLPLKLETPETKRLSIVCYLRKKIWEKTKGESKKMFQKNNNIFQNITRKNKK